MRNLVTLMGLAAGCSVLAWPTATLAQTAPRDTAQPTSSGPATDENGDIVVTALRRSTGLQKTPISVTAVTGNTLADMSITDSSQLARAVPGLVVRETANGGSSLVLRNIQAAGEPIVGLYFGETPVLNLVGFNNNAAETTPAVRLFDVQRVEVLRGPQGTLYGSSSMAGTVRIIYEDPKTDRYEGAFAGRISSVDRGALAYEGQGMVNVPLARGLLAVRVVGFYRDGGGWVDDVALNKRNTNGLMMRGGRVMARFTPASNITIDGFAVIQDLKSNIPNWPYQPYAAGGQPYVTDFKALQPTADRLRIYGGTARWDVGFATVSANASWQKRYRYFAYDLSAIAQLVGLGTAAAANSSSSSASQASQELRVSSASPGRLKWTFGVFDSVRHEFTDSKISTVDPVSGNIVEPSTLALGNLFYLRDFDNRLKQTAGFVDVSYELIDKLTLDVGTRYYHYASTITSELPIGLPAAGINVQPRGTATASNKGWLYKANLSYQATPDLLLYVDASDGFRPGGVNQAVGIPAAFGSYNPDQLKNYEVGVKSSWFGRRLTLNADLFQIDWSNIQATAQTPDGFFLFVANAGRVRAQGVEAELTVRPVPGLLLQASGSYIVAKLHEDEATNGAIIVGAGLKGDIVPYTPKVTAQGAIQYDWGIGGDLRMSARADLSYTGANWTQFRHVDAATNRLPGYANAGLRFALSDPRAGWEAAIFGTNLFNSVGLTAKDTSSIFLGVVRAASIAPRTVGVELRKNF